MKKVLIVFILSSLGLNAQGLINGLMQKDSGISSGIYTGPQCGSHHFMMDQDRKTPGYKNIADDALEQAVESNRTSQKSTQIGLVVPVVFHVVYNDSSENLPDSVIYSQLQSLNDNYNRRNPDTTSLRSVFEPYTGNPNIQFELATIDPDGNPSTGIVRKSTSIEHFGGILPYGSNQTTLIQQWVEDSLFYNFSRISADSSGGSDPWDTERYLNIWIGDIRVFEPQFNNFEELVFLGFARPPANHPNFAGTGVDTLLSNPGAIMHYVTIGPNNPNSYPAPYTNFNSISTEGDLLSHEVGHFLALRHIWGDGGCNEDDYISDTPLSNNSNQFSCNKARNSCVDSIGGVNLPDMVENFMDYSSDVCLNTFTVEQSLLMRSTLLTYFPDLYALSSEETPQFQDIRCYPNPTTGKIILETANLDEKAKVRLYTISGLLLQEYEVPASGDLEIKIEGSPGLYLLSISDQNTYSTIKIVKE